MAGNCLFICLSYMAHFVLKFAEISSTAKLFLDNDDTAIHLLQTWHVSYDEWEKLYGAPATK